MKLLLLYLAIITFTEGFPLDDSSPKRIAVVEYQPIIDANLTDDERILANTKGYIDVIEETSIFFPSDLIIFPEDTLTNNDETAVETTLGDNPCLSENYPEFFKILSCAVRNASMYTVVNLVEKVKCENSSSASKNCQNSGYFYYNTDFFFDRDGTIAGKYHKYNLFGEKGRDRPEKPEVVVFETDFGKFGVFTCFDILFKSPAQDLLTQGIDGVIFPTMWFSELPFLTSLQTQQMWAQTHNISLFAAGASNPSLGSGGSGFYDGQKGLIFGDITTDNTSAMIILQDYPYKTGVQRNEETDMLAKMMDTFFLKPDPSITDYTSDLLDLTRENEDVSSEVCHNEFCCEFSYRISINDTQTVKNSSYTYHLVAYSGIRHYEGIADAGLENCGVIACVDSSLSSCGKRFENYDDVNWPITFERIEIKAAFEKNENRTQFPNSLLSSIRPIGGSETVWEGKEVEIGGKIYIERSFSTNRPQDRLLTFAILGRNFEFDAFPDDRVEKYYH